MPDHIATAHLDSGVAPYEQSVRVGRHSITADEPAALGGADAGPSPYGLLLSSLAACTSITLRMYADRKGWTLGHVHLDLRFVRADDGTETIERVVKLAPEVTAEQRAKYAEIVEKTPVTKTLKRGTTIATSFA